MKEATFKFGEIEIETYQLDNSDWIFHAQTIVLESELADNQPNASRWLTENVPPKWCIEYKILGKKGRPARYLIEPGLYFTLSQSKTERGYRLRDFMFEDVLPSIRKNGGYIDPSATQEQLEALQTKIKLMRRKFDNL